MLEKQLEVTMSLCGPLKLALCIPMNVLLVKIPKAVFYQEMCLQGKLLPVLASIDNSTNKDHFLLEEIISTCKALGKGLRNTHLSLIHLLVHLFHFIP